MKKRLFLLSFSFLLLLCSCGHRQPTVVEEMAQFRDTLIDRGICWLCYYPPQCDVLEAQMRYLNFESLEYELLQNQCDSILSLCVYYDVSDERYDLSKDATGKLFTRDLLSNNISLDEKKGYFIELNDEYDYETYEELYTELYKSIVDFNNTPVVSDLMGYFKDLPTCAFYAKAEEDYGVHACPVDSIDRPYFENKLSQLQAYVDKKAKKFPLEIINYASSIEWQKSVLYNHSGEMIDYYYSYIFQYRLVQQIAYYCPYIELITDDISDDKMVAVAYWGFNWCDGSTYVFLKQNNGIYTVDILHGGYFDSNNIRHIDINNTDGEPMYSIDYDGANSIHYFYDGEKWHKIEIFKSEP